MTGNRNEQRRERGGGERLPALVIEPPARLVPLELGRLWVYRDLLWVLVARDVLVRYKQTIFGVLWALIQPTFQMVVFTVIFGRLARIPSDGAPYAIFAYCGLLPWSYFSGALGRVTSSMVGARHLITRVYFPRLIIPLAGSVTPLVDFCIALTVVGALMAWYGVTPGWGLVLLPGFVGLAWMTALGTGLWFAALNVHYRDVGHVLRFLTQIWMFATPIVYPASLVPEPYRAYLHLNPMTGVVEGFRWALLGQGAGPGQGLLVSVGVALVLLVGGLYFFRHMERSLADVV